MIPGQLDPYIPRHLEGDVSDFRSEPGGSVSFDHPDGYLGLAPDRSRVTLGAKQYKQTFDKDYRINNMAEAMAGQYRRKRPVSGLRQIQDSVVGSLNDAYDWGTSSQGKATGTVALLSALAAGGLGAWSGRRAGGSGTGRGLLFALLGGGLGAAATLYGQHKFNQRTMNKKASAEVTEALIRAVQNDFMLSQQERTAMLRGMAAMQSQDRDALYRMIRTSIGAGAGAIIGRVLKSKGLLPAIAGGIVGFLMGGGSSGPRPSYNRMGQLYR